MYDDDEAGEEDSPAVEEPVVSDPMELLKQAFKLGFSATSMFYDGENESVKIEVCTNLLSCSIFLSLRLSKFGVGYLQ